MPADRTHHFREVSKPSLAEALGQVLSNMRPAEEAGHPALAEIGAELDANGVTIWLLRRDQIMVRTAGWSSTGAFAHEPLWLLPPDHPFHGLLSGTHDVIAWEASPAETGAGPARLSAPIRSVDGVAGAITIWPSTDAGMEGAGRERFVNTASMITNIFRQYERTQSLADRGKLDSDSADLTRMLLNHPSNDADAGVALALGGLAETLGSIHFVFFHLGLDGDAKARGQWQKEPGAKHADPSTNPGQALLDRLGTRLLAETPVAVKLSDLEAEQRLHIDPNVQAEGSAMLVPVVVGGVQTGGLISIGTGPGAWSYLYPHALTAVALSLHDFVERCSREQIIEDESKAAQLIELLGVRLWETATLDDTAHLNPTFEALALHLGVDAILFCARGNDELRQLAGWSCHGEDSPNVDDLASVVEKWSLTTSDEVYEWGPDDLPSGDGRSRSFWANTFGRVTAIGDGPKVLGTLSLVCTGGPMHSSREITYARLVSMLHAFVHRIGVESELRRQRELEAMRSFVAATLLTAGDDPDPKDALKDALARVTHVFGCDEIVWGNRVDTSSVARGLRHRRGDSTWHALPRERLKIVSDPFEIVETDMRIARGRLAEPELGVIQDRFDDAALRALGIDQVIYPETSVTLTMAVRHGQTVGGIGLIDYAPRPARSQAELDALVQIASLLDLFETQIADRERVARRRRYDEMLVRVSSWLLDSSDAPIDELIEFTLRETGRAFEADLVIYEPEDIRTDELGVTWSSKLAQRLSNPGRDPDRMLRREFVEFGLANPAGLMAISDFSEPSRAVWHDAGVEEVTAMFTAVSDNKNAVMAVCRYNPVDWGDVERTTLLSVATHLRQAIDVAVARDRMRVHRDMDELVTQCAAALIAEESLEDALDAALVNLTTALGAISASWIEVNPTTLRLDLVHTHNISANPNILAGLQFDQETWNRAWAAFPSPRFCAVDDEPLMSAVAQAPDIPWLPRLIAPVISRDGEVAGMLDVAILKDPDSDAVLNALGTIAHLIFDITDRARLSLLFSTTFESAPSGQLLLDHRGWVHSANQALRELFPDVVGRRWVDFDSDFEPDGPEHEVRVAVGRHVRWIKVRSALVQTGQLTPVTVVHVEDVTSQRATQAILEHDANHDQLTGLANRRRLDERMATTLQEHGASVIMIDVDRFKVINDSLGHTAGDAVLVTLADRLRATIRGSDLVSRLGGDEFALLLPGTTDRTELAGLANRLLHVLSEPVVTSGFRVVPTCSLGIATGQINENPETMLRHADAALGSAKARGRNCHAFFDEEDSEPLRNRLALEMGIRAGLAANEFLPWFQPEYDLTNGAVVGLEALVRWDRPGEGIVPASRFIDLAEEIGLATAMSRLVLEQSCQLVPEWKDLGHHVSLRINITAAQLQAQTLELEVMEALARHRIAPEDLCLEVTERSLLFDVDTTITTLGRIRERGIKIAIDDFGTGFSSLQWLKRLPVDTLKIDRAFVKSLHKDHVDREIVATIIGLAKALGLDVVAEGVEEPTQVDLLLELGCARAQGWLWSPAVPAAEVPALLAASPLATHTPHEG